MNHPSSRKASKNRQLRANSKQTEHPVIRLSNQDWSKSDGVGFTVDNLESLGNEVKSSAMKLGALYPLLQPDPYDTTNCRFRGLAQGCLFVDKTQLSIIHSNNTNHEQSENVEYPNHSRQLPSIPMKASFLDEISILVEAAHRSCVSSNSEEYYGFHWKAHLIRLQPAPDQPAKATPPQPHKDNARWVFVAVLGKSNIKGGENILFNNRKVELARFTLSSMQYFALDDRRHYHHVEDVDLETEAQLGYRDAIVIELTTMEPTHF